MTAGASDLLDLTALEQAALIRDGSLSSEELTRLYLERIAAGNARVGAFVQVIGRRALRTARRKDRERRAGGPLPPFHGVPIGIKDVNLVRGTFTRYGSRALRWVFAPVDDRTTAALRRGGLVVLGKLATSELGAMPVTEPDIHPPARNPWDPAYTPGGSSGGSGAAVAAGLLPLAQGNDGAGSIRIPASFCGLFGLKPSRGRVANAYGFADRKILYTCGPLARTVEDAAAMLDVLAGLSVGAPHWAPPPPRPFQALLREPVPRLRIRCTLRSPIAPTDPEVEAAVRRALAVLEGLGHHVEEAPAPEASVEEFLPLWQQLIGAFPLPSFKRTQPTTRWLGEAGRRLAAPEVAALHARLHARFLTWCGDADLLVTPTVPVPPPRVGAFAGKPAAQAFHEAAALGVFTAAFNVTGQPAASVPAGLSAQGLPIGVQLAGPPLADARVLQVARQLEQALPWRRRAPDPGAG